MPFVPTIWPALDAIRAIGGKLGLRVFTVTVRRRVWTFTGARNTPGAPGSSYVDYDTQLVNQAADLTTWPVRVRPLNRREVISSGGQYAAGDWKVGPMTPTYLAGILAAGGTDDPTINPMPANSAVEMIWLLSSNDGLQHGIPVGGVVAELKGQESTSLHAYVILRATGRKPT